MIPPPSIALIIATYNWEGALKKTLQSVALQTILPNELIIADDGSGYATKEAIEDFKLSFPSLNIIHEWQQDNGFRLAEVRNKAIQRATSAYILQIDGDILLGKHFIEDHLRFSEQGFFATGSRVLLHPKITQQLIKTKTISFGTLRWSATNFISSFRIPLMASLLQYVYKTSGSNLYEVKGCHMAFWKSDLVLVNGYDEDYTGWGREDSDLCIRLINAGLKKKFIKFAAIQYHLFHTIAARNNLENNELLLQQAIKLNKIKCNNGLVKNGSDLEN